MLTALVGRRAGAVAVELIRYRGRTSGDVALAVLFYGGIAGGVVVISQAPGGTPGNLNTYLFGAITTTTSRRTSSGSPLLSAVVLLVTIGLGPLPVRGEPRRGVRPGSGLPVLAINLVLARSSPRSPSWWRCAWSGCC